MAAQFNITSNTGTNLYITTNSTSTGTTATGGSDMWATEDSKYSRQGPPHRIMKRQLLNAQPFMSDHFDYMKDMPYRAQEDMKILEIPYHRIYRGMKHYQVEENTLLELPDGTFIDVEDAHHYTIHDARTQVVREECTIRAFNRFLNASELLEAFIRDIAPSGIRQDQVLKVPIEAFINWLIFNAAKEDGDELPDEYYNHRCIYCKRFIARKLVVMGVNFCNALHLDGYLNRTKLLEAH